MEKVKINEKLNLFSDHWNPRIVGELNGQLVKVAKLKGEFVWHSHEDEDELFFIIKGELIIEFRDRQVILKDNEFLIVPKGTEHRPVAKEEVAVMLFEPATTLNTGNQYGEMTREKLDKI
ncbi:cupin domain-containing protein [Anditalea andensis]|uniref:Mannose-6-phosphate isomerase n=1 Tax=Anditalea andensis TaxID=1048983 RepID=A0A074KYY0_9BACT|nr:cupin domain-containing protein [Anditalea andensis]KEO74104.1 mannose-6-phosphate isomerase [Anditalea andensis]